MVVGHLQNAFQLLETLLGLSECEVVGLTNGHGIESVVVVENLCANLLGEFQNLLAVARIVDNKCRRTDLARHCRITVAAVLCVAVHRGASCKSQ